MERRRLWSNERQTKLGAQSLKNTIRHSGSRRLRMYSLESSKPGSRAVWLAQAAWTPSERMTYSDRGHAAVHRRFRKELVGLAECEVEDVPWAAAFTRLAV